MASPDEDAMRDWASTASHTNLAKVKAEAKRKGNTTLIEIIDEELRARE